MTQKWRVVVSPLSYYIIKNNFTKSLSVMLSKYLKIKPQGNLNVPVFFCLTLHLYLSYDTHPYEGKVSIDYTEVPSMIMGKSIKIVERLSTCWDFPFSSNTSLYDLWGGACGTMARWPIRRCLQICYFHQRQHMTHLEKPRIVMSFFSWLLNYMTVSDRTKQVN